MKVAQPKSRNQVNAVTVVLILLAILTVLLWFKDAADQPTGESRIGWRVPSPAKP